MAVRQFGGEIPDDLLGPELRFDLQLFYQAFSELSSCRSLGHAEGPIPWTAIKSWCDEFLIEGNIRADVFFFVRELDLAYLKHTKPKT